MFKYGTSPLRQLLKVENANVQVAAAALVVEKLVGHGISF